MWNNINLSQFASELMTPARCLVLSVWLRKYGLLKRVTSLYPTSVTHLITRDFCWGHLVVVIFQIMLKLCVVIVKLI